MAAVLVLCAGVGELGAEPRRLGTDTTPGLARKWEILVRRRMARDERGRVGLGEPGLDADVEEGVPVAEAVIRQSVDAFDACRWTPTAIGSWLQLLLIAAHKENKGRNVGGGNGYMWLVKQLLAARSWPSSSTTTTTSCRRRTSSGSS